MTGELKGISPMVLQWLADTGRSDVLDKTGARGAGVLEACRLWSEMVMDVYCDYYGPCSPARHNTITGRFRIVGNTAGTHRDDDEEPVPGRGFRIVSIDDDPALPTLEPAAPAYLPAVDVVADVVEYAPPDRVGDLFWVERIARLRGSNVVQRIPFLVLPADAGRLVTNDDGHIWVQFNGPALAIGDGWVLADPTLASVLGIDMERFAAAFMPQAAAADVEFLLVTR